MELLLFHFQVFPLWQLHAEQYIREHALFMYALLPTMEGANADLLNTAINEMIEYYKDDNERLARELRWLGIVLRRADTVVLNEKRIVEERLNMYDDLMERDPKMMRIRAESEAKGKLQGEIEGEVKGLQKAVIAMVKSRFPNITELARQKIVKIESLSEFDIFLDEVMNMSNEKAVRLLLEKL